ncbi:MAG: hypothetical protein IKF14_03330 [Atopobiaceae bacterium]|nr:hypothetical protein [Atopobiaceae bacterium]
MKRATDEPTTRESARQAIEIASLELLTCAGALEDLCTIIVEAMGNGEDHADLVSVTLDGMAAKLRDIGRGLLEAQP